MDSRRTLGRVVVLGFAALASWLALPIALSAAESLPPQPPLGANAPAELVALGQKMAALQVTSERYTSTIGGTFVLTTESSGSKSRCDRHGHCTTIRREHHVGHIRQTIHRVLKGEANLSAGTGEVVDSSGRPLALVADSSLFLYSPEGSRRSRRRPWVRFPAPASEATGLLQAVFPFHGGASGEAGFGGSGPYAGLLNLLATAEGPIVAGGPVRLDGRQTNKFTARVQQLELVGGVTPKQRSTLEAGLPSQQVEVFIDESGLPVRVALALPGRSGTLTMTTDVLAVNVPVVVKAPPANRTRRERGPGSVVSAGGSLGHPAEKSK